ncbi:hypothetical protein [Nibricoccus sp. IMCC34717]|uniref:hypothetical protein n=1 Tax=Nibricoccus sp. IMCC34717 TaxID=3034021 RepID=UPI003850FACC
MNKERFLELVNLAIDHESTPQEAAEMEAAMQASPELRQLYREYVRLHLGTVALFESSREDAPATPQLSKALARANRGEFAQRRQASWWLPVGALGTLAAAAFAVVVTQQSEPRPTASTPLANAAVPAKAAPVASVLSSPALPALETPSSTTGSAFGFNQKPESLAIHQQVKFRPINKVQNQPFVFSPEWRKLQEAQAEALKLTPAPAAQPEEMTALQFKR